MKYSFLEIADNCADYFERYLMDLTEHPIDDVQFIVIEQATGSGSAEKVRDLFAKYKKGLGKFKNMTMEVIEPKERSGYAELLNLGIPLTTAPEVFITNPRTMVFYDWHRWLDRHLNTHGFDIIAPLLNDSVPSQDIVAAVTAVGADLSKLNKAVDYFGFVNGFFTDRTREAAYIESYALFAKGDALRSLFPLPADLETSEITDHVLIKKAIDAGLKVGVAEDVFLFKAIPDPEKGLPDHPEKVREDVKRLQKHLESSGETESVEDLTERLKELGVPFL